MSVSEAPRLMTICAVRRGCRCTRRQAAGAAALLGKARRLVQPWWMSGDYGLRLPQISTSVTGGFRVAVSAARALISISVTGGCRAAM